MMEAWIFTHPDTWTRTDPSPEWQEGETDKVYMARLGYVHDSEARNVAHVNFVGAWSLWTRLANTVTDIQAEYALIVDSTSESGAVHVWLPTFPDLLAYMARYAEVGQAEWRGEEFASLVRIAELAFRAWHGHDASGVCHECDPREYAILQEMRAKRRAKEA